MGYIESLLLGVVQGVTEFLPVSSSGHLVLAQSLMSVQPTGDASFEVVVHVGTLLSILVVLRQPILDVLSATRGLLAPSQWRSRFRQDAAFKTMILVGVGTLPVLVVGLAAKNQIESLFGSPDVAAGFLLVTAGLLAMTFFVKERTTGAELILWTALLIGVAQAFAILPGISRSGTTITVALILGVSRHRAGEFSFLLAVPAILGAAILNIGDAVNSSIGVGPLLTALLAAFISGTLALKLLLAMLRRGRLWWFSPYLLLVGVSWLLWGGAP